MISVDKEFVWEALKAMNEYGPNAIKSPPLEEG